MGSKESHADQKSLSTDPSPAGASFCQRKKSENGSFVTQLRDNFHEFIHSSMDDHKTCLKEKMLRMSQIVREKIPGTDEVKSSLFGMSKIFREKSPGLPNEGESSPAK